MSMSVHVLAFLRHGRPPVFYWGRPVGMSDFRKLQLALLGNAREMERYKPLSVRACSKQPNVRSCHVRTQRPVLRPSRDRSRSPSIFRRLPLSSHTRQSGLRNSGPRGRPREHRCNRKWRMPVRQRMFEGMRHPFDGREIGILSSIFVPQVPRSVLDVVDTMVRHYARDESVPQRSRMKLKICDGGINNLTHIGSSISSHVAIITISACG